MFSYKNSFIMFPISMLLLLIVGCQDASLSAEEPAMLEETLEAVEEFITEEAVENLARRGPSDRLPGSLQWGSIIIFKNGEDFILDYPDKGLRAVNSVSILDFNPDLDNAIITPCSHSHLEKHRRE